MDVAVAVTVSIGVFLCSRSKSFAKSGNHLCEPQPVERLQDDVADTIHQGVSNRELVIDIPQSIPEVIRHFTTPNQSNG